VYLWNTRERQRQRQRETETEKGVTYAEVFDEVGVWLGDAALNLSHLADLLFQCHSREKVFDPILYGCVGVFVNAIHARRRFARSDQAPPPRLLLTPQRSNNQTLQY
jgi:hypothetical protein